MVEKELLGVAATGTEVAPGEAGEETGGEVAAAREVAFAQGAFDPHVDRKEPQSLAGEEQDAGRHFDANAWSCGEPDEGVIVGDSGVGEESEVEFAGVDESGGGGEVGGAVPEAAFAQGVLAGAGEGGRARVCVKRLAQAVEPFAEAAAQRVRDPGDVGDLLER